MYIRVVISREAEFRTDIIGPVKKLLKRWTKSNCLKFLDFSIFVPKSWCSLKKKDFHLGSKFQTFKCFFLIPSGHRI